MTVDPSEVEWTAVRAQGAGGQNVNKVASAVQLRFDVARSSLPEAVKVRLLARDDRRLTHAGVIVLKAQRHRTQERNRDDAFARLQAIVDQAAAVPIERRATRPPAASKRRRLEMKRRHGDVKASRGRVRLQD